jgi:hypothetical protein
LGSRVCNLRTYSSPPPNRKASFSSSLVNPSWTDNKVKAVDICERTAKVLTAHSQRPLPRKIRLSQTPAHGNTKAHARRRRRRSQNPIPATENADEHVLLLLLRLACLSLENLLGPHLWLFIHWTCSPFDFNFFWGVFLDHISGFLFTEHVLFLPLISFGESSWTTFLAFYFYFFTFVSSWH